MEWQKWIGKRGTAKLCKKGSFGFVGRGREGEWPCATRKTLSFLNYFFIHHFLWMDCWIISPLTCLCSHSFSGNGTSPETAGGFLKLLLDSTPLCVFFCFNWIGPSFPFDKTNGLFLVLWLLHSCLVKYMRWGSFTEEWNGRSNYRFMLLFYWFLSIYLYVYSNS